MEHPLFQALDWPDPSSRPVSSTEVPPALDGSKTIWPVNNALHEVAEPNKETEVAFFLFGFEHHELPIPYTMCLRFQYQGLIGDLEGDDHHIPEIVNTEVVDTVETQFASTAPDAHVYLVAGIRLAFSIKFPLPGTWSTWINLGNVESPPYTKILRGGPQESLYYSEDQPDSDYGLSGDYSASDSELLFQSNEMSSDSSHLHHSDHRKPLLENGTQDAMDVDSNEKSQTRPSGTTSAFPSGSTAPFPGEALFDSAFNIVDTEMSEFEAMHISSMDADESSSSEYSSSSSHPVSSSSSEVVLQESKELPEDGRVILSQNKWVNLQRLDLNRNTRTLRAAKLDTAGAIMPSYCHNLARAALQDVPQLSRALVRPAVTEILKPHDVGAHTFVATGTTDDARLDQNYIIMCALNENGDVASAQTLETTKLKMRERGAGVPVLARWKVDDVVCDLKWISNRFLTVAVGNRLALLDFQWSLLIPLQYTKLPLVHTSLVREIDVHTDPSCSSSVIFSGGYDGNLGITSFTQSGFSANVLRSGDDVISSVRCAPSLTDPLNVSLTTQDGLYQFYDLNSPHPARQIRMNLAGAELYTHCYVNNFDIAFGFSNGAIMLYDVRYPKAPSRVFVNHKEQEGSPAIGDIIVDAGYRNMACFGIGKTFSLWKCESHYLPLSEPLSTASPGSPSSPSSLSPFAGISEDSARLRLAGFGDTFPQSTSANPTTCSGAFIPGTNKMCVTDSAGKLTVFQYPL